MKKVLFIQFVLLLCIVISACSSDSGDSLKEPVEAVDHAPYTFQKKRLYLSITDWKKYHGSAQIVFYISKTLDAIKEGDNPIYPYVDNPYFNYEKAAPNVAEIEFEYGHGSSTIEYWNLTLNFEDEDSGTFKGKYESELVNGEEEIESIKGTFYITEYSNGIDEGEISLSTPIITDISNNSATITGQVSGDVEAIQEIGVCYATKAEPTLENNYAQSSSMYVEVKLANLMANTTYYIRLYAKTKQGIVYGNVSHFTTSKEEDEGNKEYSTIAAKVERVGYHEKNKTHCILVYGEYADPNTTQYLTVGFCAGTNPYPKITDISIPEQREVNNGTLRSISGLKEGTKYYIRPYHVEKDGTITYYRSTSVETLGNGIKLLAYVQSDHNFGHVNYDIKPKGTYKISVSFSGMRYYSKDLKYVTEGVGSEFFDIGTYTWENYLNCDVLFSSLETGISYYYSLPLGWSAGK